MQIPSVEPLQLHGAPLLTPWYLQLHGAPPPPPWSLVSACQALLSELSGFAVGAVTLAPAPDHNVVGDSFFTAVLVAACLGVLKLKLRLSRIAPDECATGVPPSRNEQGSKSHSAICTDGEGWWHQPLASAGECALIERARAALVELEPKAAQTEAHLDLWLLRVLRAKGLSDGDALARAFLSIWRWRQEHVPGGAGPAVAPAGVSRAALDLPHGEFATDYMKLGLRCGRSRGGHPVKIERCGLHDFERFKRSAGAEDERRLRSFYLGLFEDMCDSLNAESALAGHLVMNYEVVDFGALSLSRGMGMLSAPLTRFIVTAFASTLRAHECARRAQPCDRGFRSLPCLRRARGAQPRPAHTQPLAPTAGLQTAPHAHWRCVERCANGARGLVSRRLLRRHLSRDDMPLRPDQLARVPRLGSRTTPCDAAAARA